MNRGTRRPPCTCAACLNPNTAGRVLIAAIHALEHANRHRPGYRNGVPTTGRFTGHLKPANRPKATA